MNKKIAVALTFISMLAGNAEKANASNTGKQESDALPTVYFTKEISPESLVEIFKAVGVEPNGNVAVKISTGEGGNTHYLKPDLIGKLVKR